MGTIRTKTQAKAFLEDGDTPTGTQFDDIITSTAFVNDNQVPVLAGASVVTATSGYVSLYAESASVPANQVYARSSGGTSRRIAPPIILSAKIAVSGNTSYSLVILPSAASTISKIYAMTEGSGSVDCQFKTNDGAGNLTTVNTVAQTISDNDTPASITINTSTSPANGFLYVVTTNLTLTPNLLVKVELFEN